MGKPEGRVEWNVGVAQMPGFAESVRILAESERYSLRDIGMMFGVTGERMRQLCAKLGVTPPAFADSGMNCVRYWNDTTHRFSPIAKRELHDARRHERHRLREMIRDGYRAHMIAALKQLAIDSRGVPVTRSEAWYAISGQTVSHAAASVLLANNWHGSSRASVPRRYASAVEGLAAASGLRFHGRGRPWRSGT